MPHRHIRSLVYLFSFLIPATGFADSAVWRVANGDAVIYLAGTIHKLPPDYYPLPEEYGVAYERSQTLVFETDITAMQSREVRRRIADRSRLGDDRTLQSVLDASTWNALEQYCETYQFPIGILEPLRPAPAMLTLLSVTLQSMGITAPGVDEHFFERARSDSKDILTLESVDAQIEYLLSLDQGDPDAFVLRSLEELREARRGGLDESMTVWREGNESALVAHFLEDQKRYTPGLYQSLVVDRNRAWMHAIRRYLHTPDTELVLVGVAHLVGDQGLVTLLDREGYDVAKLTIR